MGFDGSLRRKHCFQSAMCEPEQPRSPLDMSCSAGSVFLSYRQLSFECHCHVTSESLTSSPILAENRCPLRPCAFISACISFLRSRRLSRLMY